MYITVHFLASLSTAAGTAECMFKIPDGATLDQAIARLVQRYPHLHGREAGWHLAINKIHAGADTVLHPGDSISIFPYIGGG
ncbi:MAG: MoaD/ThiS family protein [Anaerolineae bacterium]|nr:MoaD/ThiS family protein [Anaerolineae bacterium]